MKLKLYSCPWCGQLPEIKKILSCHDSHYNYHKISVKCNNSECLMQPETPAFDSISMPEETAIKKAINIWNMQK